MLGVLWTVVGLYALLFVLLKIPAVQGWIGTETARLLGAKLGTKVSVGRVEIGLFNRIIIDDALLRDQSGKPMLQASRLSAKADVLKLLEGTISLSSVQLFGVQANLYQQDALAKPNFQFVIDSLASKEPKRESALDLAIHSLIVRHAAIRYDRHDLPPTHGRFNTAHLSLSDLSANIVLNHLTNTSVDAQVKKLSFREQSGLQLRQLAFRLQADTTHAELSDFSLALPQSHLNIDRAEARFPWRDGAPDLASLVYEATIDDISVTPSDLAPFEQKLKPFNTPLNVSFKASGSGRRHQLANLRASGLRQGLSLNIPKATVETAADGSGPAIALSNAAIGISGEALAEAADNLRGSGIQLPDAVLRMGDIAWLGDLAYGRGSLRADGSLTTDAGKATVEATAEGSRFSSHLVASDLDIGRILEREELHLVSADLRAEGAWPIATDGLTLKGSVSDFDYRDYRFGQLTLDGSYKDRHLEGDIRLDDPNAGLTLSGSIDLKQHEPALAATASVRHFNPHAIGLTGKYADTSFEADIEADISGLSPNTANGSLSVSRFVMDGPDGGYSLERLILDATSEGGERSLAIDSDFGQIALRGQYDYATLSESIIHFLSQKLPMLPGLPKVQPSGSNVFALNADIRRTDWLQAFFGIPLALDKPLRIDGSINDRRQQMFVDLLAPRFRYDDNPYENVVVSITTNDRGQLEAMTTLTKLMGNGKRLAVEVNAQAGGNEITSTIAWNDNQLHPMRGSLHSTTELFRNEKGEQTAHVRVHPSEVLMGDTAWQVEPSDIIYSRNNLVVDYFAVAHNRQHIIIQGKATDKSSDSLVVDLNDVDVNYITNLVNFHSVEFGGKVSGRAAVRSAFGNPDAAADIVVRQFTFIEGRMGTLFANARWNKTLKQIDIDAHADEPEGSGYGQTLVRGYISPAKNYIDLAIKPRRARAEFLEELCGSFMDNVEVGVTGDLRLAGDLSAINLTGQAVADGELDITSLNTHYRLCNDTIRLIPNEIVFHNDTIRDRRGNIGIVNGALHHKALTRLTYDIDIAAQNLLCYDFREYGDNTFYGTVYGTGDCSIRGRSGSIDFDINVTPQEDSFIEYNAASPDAITNREFITWNSRRTAETGGQSVVAEATNTAGNEAADTAIRPQQAADDGPAPRNLSLAPRSGESDLRLNFLINATPQCTLRVLMDQESGDCIALNGTGAIRATFYNKGGFDMFGNYLIDHGTYKLTIQNLMKKEFQFQSGSTIVFGGDPYLAALNLKALYTVNGVALSDLQLGRIFSSNNVRVDCLMNISGTPQQPHVDFDLDMPTVSADAKQMVRQLINSEEEMNQQVIYLLSIGRFYTQNANNADENQNQSQTSLAMQSLLSGTISQQINNVIGSFVHSSNWNFGANISTGDEGWNNAEYEGLLSGRLLNNRLLINGQFGYRDNANATTSFIGDFDVRYLLLPNGNLAVKVYNQTNDRYFTRSSLNTQGIGFVLKKDFNSWRDLIGRGSKPRKE